MSDNKYNGPSAFECWLLFFIAICTFQIAGCTISWDIAKVRHEIRDLRTDIKFAPHSK